MRSYKTVETVFMIANGQTKLKKDPQESIEVDVSKIVVELSL
jgi:hypothetical protein